MATVRYTGSYGLDFIALAKVQGRATDSGLQHDALEPLLPEKLVDSLGGGWQSELTVPYVPGADRQRTMALMLFRKK